MCPCGQKEASLGLRGVQNAKARSKYQSLGKRDQRVGNPVRACDDDSTCRQKIKCEI